MRLYTAIRSYCTHAATHRKKVTAHMRLHTANGSYCTHVATHNKEELLHTCGNTHQTGVTANMRLHTATGVTAHMGLHITNRSYCTHAATHSTTPPFNFYSVNRASQISKDSTTWRNWNTAISTSSVFWFSFNFMFIYNKRHYLQTYTVPNCCGHTQYLKHTLFRIVVDIHST